MRSGAREQSSCSHRTGNYFTQQLTAFTVAFDYDMKQLLTKSEWEERAKLHYAAVSPFTRAFVKRRDCGSSHPVQDFLFTYYSFSPRKLEQWHPGFHVEVESLEEQGIHFFASQRWYRYERSCYSLDFTQLTSRDARQASWILTLSQEIASRPPRFSCYGLHEWAMVYRSGDIRHAHPLRLAKKTIDEVVESQRIVCSHYDAFRFFAPEARGLNILQPSLPDRITLEQGGCIHANMDLYKWAYRLSPWIGSDMIRECFFLACYAREIDMRASPYDLEDLGLSPIKIETVDGRSEYQAAQRDLADKAALVRGKLVDEITLLLAMINLEIPPEPPSRSYQGSVLPL